MDDVQIQKVVEEIRGEQHVSPFEKDTILIGYVKEAEFNINNEVGVKINYFTDLDAKSLLKDYVMYARHARLAEFKELYTGSYEKLRAYYYKHTNL